MRSFTALLVTLALLPAFAAAETDTSLQTQIIAMLSQVIELQKTLIMELQEEVAGFAAQNVVGAAATKTAEARKCQKVAVPACASAPIPLYDAYNCVLAYTCTAPVAAPVAAASCPAPPSTSSTGPLGGSARCTAGGQSYAHEEYMCKAGRCALGYRCCNGRWYTNGEWQGAQACAYWAGLGASGELLP